jgi:hypothetical protein
MKPRMTHASLVIASLVKVEEQDFQGNRWGARHVAEWKGGITPHVRALVGMVESLARYADAHYQRFESRIGDDGVLGPSWESMVRAARELLNGEAGNLDCGTVDRLLGDMLEMEGFDRDR